MKNIHRNVLKCALLLALMTNGQLATAQQPDLKVQNQSILFQLPMGELKFSTNFNGNSDQGWRPAKLEVQTMPDDTEVSLQAFFENGEVLKFQRNLEITENTLKGKDQWTVDSELTGNIHYDITLPMEVGSPTSIETDAGSITLSEVSSVSEIKYFLESPTITTLTLRNYLGADVVFTFTPTRFQIMAVPERQIMHLRFFVNPPSTLITNYESDWSFVITPAANP